MANCPDCGGFLPEGCTCAYESSDSVLVTPSTSNLATIFPSARRDPNPDNLIEDSSGLRTPPNPLALAKPRVGVVRASTQTLGLTTSYQAIVFQSAVWDTHSMWPGAGANASKIICVEAGWHHVGGFYEVIPGGVGVNITGAIVLNEERELSEMRKRFVETQDEALFINLWTVVYLEPDDCLQLSCWSQVDAAGAVTINNAVSPFFFCHWSRPPD